MPRGRSKRRNKSRSKSRSKSRRRRSKSRVPGSGHKVAGKNVLVGECKIMMAVYSGNTLVWKPIKSVGSINDIQRSLGGENVDPTKDLTLYFRKLWFMKLSKEKALKVAYISFIQECIKKSYLGLVPNWLGKKVTFRGMSDRDIEDMYMAAYHVLACMLLYRYDNTMNNGAGHAAGHLLTEDSKRHIMEFQKSGKYNNAKELYEGMKRRVHFKELSTIQGECKNYDNRHMTIWDVISGVINTKLNSKPNLGKSRLNGNGKDFLCKTESKRFFDIVKYLLSHDQGLVDFLLYKELSPTSKEAQTMMSTVKNGNKLPPGGEQEIETSTEGEVAEGAEIVKDKLDTEGGEGGEGGENAMSLEEIGAGLAQEKLDNLSGNKVNPPPPSANTGGGKKKNRKTTPRIPGAGIVNQAVEGAKNLGRRGSAALRGKKNPPADADDLFTQMALKDNSFGMPARYHQRIGSQERYTGMTPSAYSKHSQSMTGFPQGGLGPISGAYAFSMFPRNALKGTRSEFGKDYRCIKSKKDAMRKFGRSFGRDFFL